VQTLLAGRDPKTLQTIALAGGGIACLVMLAVVAVLTMNKAPEKSSPHPSQAVSEDGPLERPAEAPPGLPADPVLAKDSPGSMSPFVKELPTAAARIRAAIERQPKADLSGHREVAPSGDTFGEARAPAMHLNPAESPPSAGFASPSRPATAPIAEQTGPAGGWNAKRRDERLLIVSEEGVAALRDGDHWQLIDFPPGFTPRPILWSYVDRQGACWLSGHDGLTRLDGKQVEFLRPTDGLPDRPLGHVFEDSRGRLWVGSWGGGVALREQGAWRILTTRDGLRHDDVNGCAEDSRGRIWIVGDAGKQIGGMGVSLFADNVLETQGLGAQLAVNVMSIDGDDAGNVYLGCIGGLLVVTTDSRLHRITPDQGLPQKTPQATYVDSRGRVWAGTWGGGIVQVDVAGQTVLASLALSAAGHVRRIVEDSYGAVWVASLEGLWCLQEQAWQRIDLPPQIQQVSVAATVPANVASQLAKLGSKPPDLADEPAGGVPPPAPVPPAATPDEPAPTTPPHSSRPSSPATLGNLSEYLTADGKLTGDFWLGVQYRVPVTNVNGVPIAAQIRIVLSVFADGRWQTDGGITVATQGRSVEKSLGLQQGRMAADELRTFASTLAAQDPLTLPSRVSPENSALFNRSSLWANIRVRFRGRTCQATFVCSALDQHVVRTSTVSGKTIFERLDRLCVGVLAATPVWSTVIEAGQGAATAP
jgi:sugar lactone lactonase YvrE